VQISQLLSQHLGLKQLKLKLPEKLISSAEKIDRSNTFDRHCAWTNFIINLITSRIYLFIETLWILRTI
jgi:hypothetical protein